MQSLGVAPLEGGVTGEYVEGHARRFNKNQRDDAAKRKRPPTRGDLFLLTGALKLAGGRQP